MKKTNSIFCVLCLTMPTFQIMAESAGNEASNPIRLCCMARAKMPSGSLKFVCAVSNQTEISQQFEYFQAYANTVLWYRYGEMPTYTNERSYMASMVMLSHPVPDSYGINLNPGQQFMKEFVLPPPYMENFHWYSGHELDHFWYRTWTMSSPTASY